MSELTTRRCPRCEVVKDLDAFAVDRSKTSGRKSSCRLCDAASARAYYWQNRERVIERVLARYRS